MEHLAGLGKLFIGMGALLALVGLALVLAPHVPFLGRLPGDILIQRDGFTFYFPLATVVLLSILTTLVLNLLPRLFR